MTQRRTDRKLLSPVLSDEPLVGENLTRRLRIVLLAMLVAFLLTNITSYLIGQAVRADADRDTRTRVAALERQVGADLEERRLRRDAEKAAQDAALQRLRADYCVVLDRVQPRDAAVLDARRRYGCTANPTGVAPTVPGSPPPSGVASAPPGGNGRGQGQGVRVVPSPVPGPVGPSGPPGRPGPSGPKPSPPATPPGEAPDDGLICLPVLGCIL